MATFGAPSMARVVKGSLGRIHHRSLWKVTQIMLCQRFEVVLGLNCQDLSYLTIVLYLTTLNYIRVLDRAFRGYKSLGGRRELFCNLLRACTRFLN